MQNKDNRKRTKTNITPTQLLELGKILPQAVDLEEAVLGAMMLDKECLSTIFNILTNPEIFYKDAHKHIFTAIKSLYEKAEPADILTVIQELKKIGELEVAGGAFYVTQLTNRVASAANVEVHARIILEKFLQRELIRISTDTLQHSYEDTSDIFGLLEKAEQDLFSVSTIFTKKNFESVRVVGGKALSEIEAMKLSGSSGLSTGFKRLDAITGGWHKGDLIILAARPGMGKSSAAMQFARHATVIEKKTVAVFSLEMTSTQLVMRLFSAEAEIPAEKIFQGTLSDIEMGFLNQHIGNLVSSPLYIDDTPALSLFEFRSKARRLKAQHDVQLIIVDYLQLMVANDGTGRSREQEVSLISRTLKAVAKELDVPILALSQMSRASEQRTEKKGRPQLSDLRECLSVETSMIYTDAYFQKNTSNDLKLLSLGQNKIEISDSKNIPKEKNIVYRLKTSTGRFIDCTENHPVLTSDGYKKLKDITQDDSIAIAVKWESKGHYIPESKFIGWMLGNGCMYGYNVPGFITQDKIVSDEFCKFIKTRFGFYPKEHPHYKSKVFQWDITNSPTGNRTKEGNVVTSWLRENDLWGNKAKDKCIPEWFMKKADHESICNLIAGLYETDGSIAIGKSRRAIIKYGTTSLSLANQLMYLLAKIGIIANIDDGYFSDKATTLCYNINIASFEQQILFKKYIPIIGCKKIKLDSIRMSDRQSYHQNKLGRKTTLEIKRVIEKNKIPFRVQIHGNRRLTKKPLIGLVNKYPELKQFKWIVSENIFWDAIDYIKEIGEVNVFDRNVPKNHNFIVNGIIVHNSGAIEQDADMVMFVYRPDKMGYETDEEGNSTAGVAEIIIAKHRNGRTGSPSFFFNEQYVRFEDNGMSNDPYGLKPQIAAMNQNKPSDPITDVPSSNITFEDEDENIGY